jgi:hypothetical protein
MPGDDAAVELQDLGLQRAQLTAKSSKAHPGDLRDDASQTMDKLSASLTCRSKKIFFGAINPEEEILSKKSVYLLGRSDLEHHYDQNANRYCCCGRSRTLVLRNKNVGNWRWPQ